MGFLEPTQCPACGGAPDSTRHQMTCVAPHVESPEASQIRRLRKALQETIAQREKAYETVDRLKAALETVRSKAMDLVQWMDDTGKAP